MTVHPEMAGLLRAFDQLGLGPVLSGPAPESRATMRALLLGRRDPATLAAVSSVSDETVPGPAGAIPVRVYRPEALGTIPTVVHFHGGGWTVGDLDTAEGQARRICRDVGAVVVSVDYRLAPEAPFPAAHDDAVAATRYVAEHIDAFGGDPTRLAVAGDSAGANLSAATAVAFRDQGAPHAAQLLIYPACDLAKEYPSYEENAEGYMLTRDEMRSVTDRYLEGTNDRTDPRASPLYTPNLGGLAPAVVAVAEHDPIRDDGIAYAQALEEAGTPVRLHFAEGMIHGFAAFTAASPAADVLVSALTADLADLLSSSGTGQAAG